MYIYHALINTLSAHTIHINLNMICYTHVQHSPTKTTHTQQTKHRSTLSSFKAKLKTFLFSQYFHPK